MNENPWENIEQKYPVGSTVEGEVSKITDFGAFVKLATGIEGLIHISELSNDNVAKVEDVLKVGDKREFRIIKVNQEEHKLGLSLKPEGAQSAPKKKAAFASASAGEKTQSKSTEKKVQPKGEKREKVAQAATARPASKVKSQLQLELEKYAGSNSESESTDEEQ